MKADEPQRVLVKVNCNAKFMQTWLESTPIGFVGMARVREYKLDGTLIKDETKPTGVIGTWE